MATGQIFLSSVSLEFRSYRDALRRDLDRPNVTVKVQEDFIATGTETLDKLDSYIRQCDAVIHLVGDMTGALAQAPSVAVIQQLYHDFDKRFPMLEPFLQADGPALSYTQWEAWLALYHGKMLIIAVPEKHARRSERYVVDEQQRASQQAHLARLANVEHYPEVRFANADRLAVDILRSHLQEILAIAKKIPSIERRDTIPHAGSRFVGRKREQAELREKIVQYSLVTVAGAPGAGKTRLTMQVARLLEPDFDAIWFVPLPQLPEFGAIPQKIAHVLQIKGQPDKDLVDLAAETLKRGRQLLILDNCETVLNECAAVVNKLRVLCGDLHLVLTSRMDLGTAIELGVEYVYRVPPLELPDPDRLSDLKSLVAIESVQLLLARVQARSDTFRLTKANAKKVTQLCCGLDGIPLAVELVAAQMDILSLDSVLEQWPERLDFSHGDVVQLEQQVTTLRNTIRISYDLLGREQQGERLRTLFRGLSVFSHGWTIEAALIVCGEPNETIKSIQELMKPLRRASLIEAEEVAGENRFRYLDAIREFAFVELVKEGRDKELGARHARWAMEFAERWQPRLFTEEQAVALTKLIVEADNCRAAILWAHQWKDTEMVLRLTSALWRLMEIKGFYREGESRLRMALQVPGAKSFPLLCSKTLSGLSILAFRRGDLETSKRCSQQSLNLEKKYGVDRAGEANALNDLGIVAHVRGEYRKALELFSQSLKIEQKRGDERCIAVGLSNIGELYKDMGSLDKAKAYVEASLIIFDETRNRREAAFALRTLGEIERYQGQYEAASRYIDRSLKICQNLGDPKGIAETMLMKAAILIAKHDFGSALDLLVESGGTRFLIDDEWGIAQTLEQLASLAGNEGKYAKAVVLHAVADKIRKKLRLPLPRVAQLVRDARIENARNALGNAGFDKEWERGYWMSPTEAFALGVNRKNILSGGSEE